VLGGVWGGDLVEDLGRILQGDEAVREASGDVERVARVGGEHHGEMPAARGRAGADVHDHVPDRAAGAADELDLLERRGLEVQAAQGAAAVVEGDAALGDVRIEAVGLKLSTAVRTGEKAAIVLDALGFEDEGARERRLPEDHAKTLTSGTATTKRPPQERTSAICSMTSSLRFQGRMST
jgi:hypothetical protein